MIKFFRRFRLQLLGENKFAQYLSYAIGEIILVVVGILIALALNNWNQDRKRQVLEVDILKEIREDLLYSAEDMERGLDAHLRSLRMTVDLRNQLLSRAPLNDSTTKLLWFAGKSHQFIPRNSGYEALKSAGFDVLQNDSLRRDITYQYERRHANVIQLGRERVKGQDLDIMDVYVEKYLELSDSTYSRNIGSAVDEVFLYWPKVHRYDEMLDDKLLHLRLDIALRVRESKINIYSFEAARTRELIQWITEEINLLEE